MLVGTIGLAATTVAAWHLSMWYLHACGTMCVRLLPDAAAHSRLMSRTAVCTMVQNEAGQISEWLAYHHYIIGIPHFYLYSDCTTDATRAAVDSYVRRGVVTWIPWTENAAQPIWDHLNGPERYFDQIKWEGDSSTWPKTLADFFDGRWFAYKQYLSNRDCWMQAQTWTGSQRTARRHSTGPLAAALSPLCASYSMLVLALASAPLSEIRHHRELIGRQVRRTRPHALRCRIGCRVRRGFRVFETAQGSLFLGAADALNERRNDEHIKGGTPRRVYCIHQFSTIRLTCRNQWICPESNHKRGSSPAALMIQTSRL